MSMKLNLGVDELPYSHADGHNLASTGDVAEYLENKYHVMQTFYDLHGQEVADDIANSMAGSLESIMQGADISNTDPFATANSSIENRFKQYLEREEIATVGGNGVPTEAALQGKSSRFKAGKNGKWSKKSKKKIGVRRPSFIDTGLYMASFMSWVKVK